MEETQVSPPDRAPAGTAPAAACALPASGSRYQPLTLALASGGVAAAVEFLVMFLNPFVPLGQSWPVALFNALALGAVLVPGLYVVVFRPLGRTVDACFEAEATLRRVAGAGMDALVRLHPHPETTWLSPLSLALLTGLSIFGAETVVMGFVPSLAAVHPWPDALVDSLALTLVVTPILYFSLFRPLNRTLADCRRIEDSLREAHRSAEERVAARNAELNQANARLQQEVRERREAEERYRLLVESMNDGFCIVDEEGVITYVNQKLAEMAGYGRGEFLGHRPEEFLAEESRPVMEAQLARRRRGEPGVYQAALRARDGRRVQILVSSTPLRDEAGAFRGSFAVVTDITDLKRTEEDLLHWRSYLQVLSAQLLAAQERERERVARELHDGIGQTLSGVKFLVETAFAEPSGAPSGEDVKRIVARLQGAVEEVRRIGMALRPSILDDLGILATVRWFCREFRQTYPDLALEVEVELDEGDVPEPLKIVLFRVLQEALNNAAKHSQARRVRVALVREDGAVGLEVQDDGVGFSVEQALALRSARRSLGLDSMRERTHLSGGSFWIDSAPGKGTRVTASWPASSRGAGVGGGGEGSAPAEASQ